MAGPPLARTASNTSSSSNHFLNRPLRAGSSTLPSPPKRPVPPGSSPPRSTTTSSSSPDPPVHPSILQPRVAVVLNVPSRWHPWLFALRLCSILPAVWWGLPSALQLLLRLLPRQPDLVLAVAACAPGLACELDQDAAAARYALTETALATIWALLSRWNRTGLTCGMFIPPFDFEAERQFTLSSRLINYTPQATMVRLFTINAISAYITSTVLTLSGGFDDPRLLLPGWIGIATTLTGCYHITHQKINIRKETSTSINVFSFASYISMVTLLFHLHSSQPTYPPMPLIAKGRFVWQEVACALARLRQFTERTEL
ncbi:hypothetical protein HJFPF1_05125 [Paramyrothecium foliicola]|nr:hypothetical protein HJFPF1_05125 [Paramyrothecium foliicola]